MLRLLSNRIACFSFYVNIQQTARRSAKYRPTRMPRAPVIINKIVWFIFILVVLIYLNPAFRRYGSALRILARETLESWLLHIDPVLWL